MRKYGNAPTVCMFIDTSNKTIEQVKAEVINRVETEFSSKLLSAKASMGKDEYELVKSILEVEKIKILNSYLRQVELKMSSKSNINV